MAASATFALNAGLWLRRARLDIIAPDLRHLRRAQAEIPLIDLSEFARPSLSIIRRWKLPPQIEPLMSQIWPVRASVPILTQDSQRFDSVPIWRNEEDTGMHLAVSGGSSDAGRLGWRAE